ncbi:MAG: PilZ domain-containing protein [Pseudolabrys sp.]
MNREKRITKRQPLRYSAWVALTAEERCGCVISDVSETGARIDVQDSAALPDHFVLMLTSTGSARRFCRVMWREPNQIGVQFTRSLAEAAEPAKPNVQVPGVPSPDLAPGEDEPAAPQPVSAEPAKTA